jgi:hypothetical protein
MSGPSKQENAKVLLDQPRGAQNEVLRASIQYFKGRKYASLRVFYLDAQDGEWKPSRNGINVPADELASLLKGIEALRKELSPTVAP